MYTRDELAEELATRREQLMHRASELREEFADRVEEDAVANFVGWTLISAGLAWGVTKWARGSRRFTTLLLPVGFIAAGSAVLAGTVAWNRRAAHIDEAEVRVREELSALDPLARIRVIRDAASEAVPFVKRINIRN